MKKVWKTYCVVWAVLLALFNVIAFASVGWKGLEKDSASFWIGYGIITLTFVGQLICAHFAFREDNRQKVFYNMSLFTTSYTGLILSFVFGGQCMLLPFLPYWIGMLLCGTILVLSVIAVAKTTVAIELVNDTDAKVKNSTSFIRTMTAEAEQLMSRAKNEEIRAECKKVYEAFRYSDPMSNGVLANVETNISIKFSKLSEAVVADDLDVAIKVANELVALLDDRNKKGKLMK